MAGQRWILVAVLLGAVLLGGLAFWTRGLDEGGRSRPPAPEADTGQPAGEPAPSALASAREIAAPPAGVERAPVTPPSTPETVAAPRWPVLVVEALSQRPVVAAELWVVERGDYWGVFGFEERTKSAPAARTNEQGLGQLPIQDSGAWLLGRAPGLLGAQYVEAWSENDGPVRLELHADWDVEVEVLHADGRPAARVPLDLARFEDGRRTQEDTDGDGKARFRHVGAALRLAGLTQATLQVQLPLEPPLATEISAAPRAPIRFRLPPLASVEVTVLDAEQTPVADRTELELGLVWPGEARDISPFSHLERRRIEAHTLGGRALFEHVQPGAEIELLVQLGGLERKVYFPGPARAAELLRHTVILGLDYPLLEFRVLEAPGRPLVDTPLQVHVNMRSSFMLDRDEQAPKTDSSGRFRLELRSFQEGDQRVLLVSAHEETLSARLDLSRSFEPGLVPMGDLLLSAPPLVVAGRVVDGTGQAVEDATVEVEQAVTEDVEGDKFWYWQRLERELRSDAQGAFRVQAQLDARRVRLRARSDERRSEYEVAPVGASSVELVLRETGSLAGSLLLDPSLPTQGLQIALVPEDSAARGTAQDSDWVERDGLREDGTFLFLELLPGRYRFSLRARTSRPLIEVPGIEISGGEICRDARLQGLDLRTSVFARRLTLVFPDPWPDVHGGLRYSGSGEASDQRYCWFRENPVLVVTELARFDGTLSVTGFRSVRLEGVSGDREVLLQPSLRVRLVLPANVPLPAAPVYLKAALAPVADENQIDWGAEVFDERREIRCLASASGSMKVVWIAERHNGGSAIASTLEGLPEQYVEVLDVGYEQRFELRAEPEALSKALAEWAD